MNELVVLDSPGTIGVGHAKNIMGRGKEDRILMDPENALKKAQHVLVVQDATATGDYIHHRVLHLLHRNSQLTSSLVLNKIDLVNRRSDLLELTRILTNGQVAGVPIKSVQNTVLIYNLIPILHLYLGKEFITLILQIGRLGIANNLKLHDESLTSADHKWTERYRSLITKPINQCGYAETKRIFMNIRGWSHFGAVFFGLLPYFILVFIITETLNVYKGGRRIAEIGRRVNDHMHTLFQRQLFVRILVKHNNKIVDVIRT
uniref:G domain-containing protein n=1 Tax=Heterorhabditis bacteriophora TaxID=37862 RepID=A0A1I7WSV9_HETBA